METVQNPDGLIKSFAGKGVFPHKFAFTLLIPLRNIFLSPKKLVHRLELRDTFQVLELGPGPGYFSPSVAREIISGKLYLSDIQQEMLDYAKMRLDKKRLQNVEYHLCNGHNFDFPDNFFDRIFMVTVIGEVENKEKYVKEFFRMLKPEGILSVSEMAGDPDKMSMNELSELISKEKFLEYKCFGTKRNYTLNFLKPVI